MEIQLKSLKKKVDRLQKTHGHPEFTALYGTGCIDRPDLFLILMNPTARNISVHKSWKGLKASWLGTRNFWKVLHRLRLLSAQLFDSTQKRKPEEWDDAFCREVYAELSKKKVFITNLGRSTQPDARPLPNSTFAACTSVMKEEIAAIRPKTIITFGNQVSSALLGRTIKVSESRKTRFDLEIEGRKYPVYTTYYPVGMGIMNMDKAIEDVEWIRTRRLR